MNVPALKSNSPFEFKNWRVYQTSLNFSRRIFRTCRKWPQLGPRGLQDQIRRSVSSIPLNIAEGFGRFSKRDKLHFARIARGSLFEVVATLDLAHELGYIEESLLANLNEQAVLIMKMLNALIRSLSEREK